MRYDHQMDVRRAPKNALPDLAADWVEEPLNADDIAACEEAEAAVERGEWVDGEIGMAELDAMIARHRARVRRA